MSPHRSPDARVEESADPGFVLVAVLWILSALATLASIYSVYATNTVMASHVADDRLQAEASIRSGIEMAVYRQLAAPKEGRPSRGAFELRVGRTTVAVHFMPESARIDLNAAPAELLAGLFMSVGTEPKLASIFADRVVGWRTTAAQEAPSAEAQFYAEQRVRYPPRQSPFDSALELALLPGLPEPVVERVLPFVTVFTGQAGIDVASADRTVLAALPGMTAGILAAVLKARASDPGDERALAALLGPAKSYASADASRATRALVDVGFRDGRRIHAEVVYRLNDKEAEDKGGDGKVDEPYEILYWSDDFDGPLQFG